MEVLDRVSLGPRRGGWCRAAIALRSQRAPVAEEAQGCRCPPQVVDMLGRQVQGGDDDIHSTNAPTMDLPTSSMKGLKLKLKGVYTSGW